ARLVVVRARCRRAIQVVEGWPGLVVPAHVVLDEAQPGRRAGRDRRRRRWVELVRAVPAGGRRAEEDPADREHHDPDRGDADGRGPVALEDALLLVRPGVLAAAGARRAAGAVARLADPGAWPARPPARPRGARCGPPPRPA